MVGFGERFGNVGLQVSGNMLEVTQPKTPKGSLVNTGGYPCNLEIVEIFQFIS